MTHPAPQSGRLLSATTLVQHLLKQFSGAFLQLACRPACLKVPIVTLQCFLFLSHLVTRWQAFPAPREMTLKTGGEPPLEYGVDLNAMRFVGGARENAASDGAVTAGAAAEAFQHGYTLQVLS